MHARRVRAGPYASSSFPFALLDAGRNTMHSRVSNERRSRMESSKARIGLACASALGMAVLATPLDTGARVTQVTIASRAPAFSGAAFGTAGIVYEQIRGTAKGEINPADRRNAVITDITLAPKNARGNVEYTTTFTLLKPVDMTKSNRLMYFEVVNRGNHLLPGNMNVGGDPGDGFLYRNGTTYLWSGWQGDIPIAATTGAQEGIDVPIAKNPDGSSVTGPTFARFIAVAQTSGANTTTQSLPGLGRTPASLDTTQAKLISFTRENNQGQKAGVVQVPSTDWAFADCRTTPFPGTPDATRICLKSGFNPSLGYELTYTAKDPLVLGVGMAAMRDVNSFFRYASADDVGTANPIAGNIAWAIGHGISQSGRYLKNYLLLGFNEDEQGRILWDGADTNIAGQMGQFNIRFAQPGNIANIYEPGAEGPLWWSAYNDTTRGRGVTSLLTRCNQTNTCPKIFEDYGGPELWYSRGGVGISGTDPAAQTDIALPPNVRRYYYAGTTHGGGAGGFNPVTAAQNNLVLPANPNPELETRRALMVDLIDWVTKGVAPPPSAYPMFADGTLVRATAADMGWPNIPLAPSPDGVVNNLFDYDMGSTFRYNDESGVIANQVPPIKQVIPTYVSRVDSDGNDVAGLKSLLFQLPLATYVPWNPVASGPLAGLEGSLAAGSIPFARTKAERTIRLFSTAMTGAQEAPPTTSTGTGTFQLTLRGNSITCSGSASGLTGPITGAHIHIAPAGVAGPIIVPLTVSGNSFSCNAGASLTDDQVTALLNGGLYANAHTAANPGGEVRGQIAPAAGTNTFTDPRLSIEERYGSVYLYIFRANAIASDLVSKRLLLPEDAARLINQALNDLIRNGVLPKEKELDGAIEPYAVDDSYHRAVLRYLQSNGESPLD